MVHRNLQASKPRARPQYRSDGSIRYWIVHGEGFSELGETLEVALRFWQKKFMSRSKTQSFLEKYKGGQ